MRSAALAVWASASARAAARAGEGCGHVEGEAGALKRQVREVEPHLLAGDVLHLGEIGADALDEVRLAGSGAAAPVRRAGEEGLGQFVGHARLAQAGDGGVERSWRPPHRRVRPARGRSAGGRSRCRRPMPLTEIALGDAEADSGRVQALALRRRGRGSGRRTGSPGGSKAGRDRGRRLPCISSASANSAAARSKSPAAVRAAARSDAAGHRAASRRRCDRRG